METKHLKNLLVEVERQQDLWDRADETLQRWQSEPLMDGLYETPQSANHHAEGLTVRHHLRRMLACLYSVLDGRIQLLEIEEFARMKGYAGEIEEMQQTILENAATFEVFVLVHDLGKQFRVTIDDKDSIHYFGHEKDIYRPDVQALLKKMAEAYRLQPRDVELIVGLTSQHMEPLRRLRRHHDPKAVELFNAFAVDQGLDADDFIDALQAAVLLDQVFGSWQIVHEKHVIDPTHLINFLIAEQEYAPWKRAKKEAELALARRQAENKIWREVGLDGGALMALTRMKPGRQLGDLLKKIQASVKENEPMSDMDPLLKEEIERRVLLARAKLASLQKS